MLPHRFEPSLDDDGTRLLTDYNYDTSVGEHDEDSFSDTSDSEVDSEEDTNQTEYLASSHSLGKMVPHPQTAMVSLYDTIRHHTLIVESRDRDLEREHLFHFNVSFRSPCQQTTQTERIKRKTLRMQITQRKALGNDSSYATHISSEQLAQFDNEDHPNCLDSVPRKCTILQSFDNIHTLQCQHVIMPDYPHMLCIDNPSYTTTNAHIGMPLDVETISVPHTLAATGDNMRCCTWSCIPHYDKSTYIHYKSINTIHEYITPMFSLESLRLKLHVPGSTLLHTPFDTNHSPDIHHIEGISIQAGGEILELTLTHIPTNCSNPLLSGHVVSMRDIRWTDGLLLSSDQKQLQQFLCSSIVHVQLTVLEDVTSTAVKLDLTKSGLHVKASDLNGISVGPNHLETSSTLLMNESMQYRLYFDVGCKERQLVQRTAVDAI